MDGIVGIGHAFMALPHFAQFLVVLAVLSVPFWCRGPGKNGVPVKK